jgi:hypothetical protein
MTKRLKDVLSYGGGCRTRTCKGFPPVDFKSTALPIRTNPPACGERAQSRGYLKGRTRRLQLYTVSKPLSGPPIVADGPFRSTVKFTRLSPFKAADPWNGSGVLAVDLNQKHPRIHDRDHQREQHRGDKPIKTKGVVREQQGATHQVGQGGDLVEKKHE